MTVSRVFVPPWNGLGRLHLLDQPLPAREGGTLGAPHHMPVSPSHDNASLFPPRFPPVAAR